MSTPIRVLGFGSILGPDRFGWAVVDALADAPAFRELPQDKVSLRRLERLDSATLEALRDAELAVLVDALVSDDGPSGRLMRLEDLNGLAAVRSLSTHGLDLATLLRIGRALGALPHRLIIHAVTIDATCALPPEASHEGLGPHIGAAVTPCIEAIVADIRTHLAPQGPVTG